MHIFLAPSTRWLRPTTPLPLPLFLSLLSFTPPPPRFNCLIFLFSIFSLFPSLFPFLFLCSLLFLFFLFLSIFLYFFFPSSVVSLTLSSFSRRQLNFTDNILIRGACRIPHKTPAHYPFRYTWFRCKSRFHMYKPKHRPTAHTNTRVHTPSQPTHSICFKAS